jgi:hypothetical protein
LERRAASLSRSRARARAHARRRPAAPRPAAQSAAADGPGRRAQEVQSNHFTEFLAPELQKHGYTAIYKKKTTEIYTGSAYAIDGCATFFRRDRFALVKKYEARPARAAPAGGARRPYPSTPAAAPPPCLGGTLQSQTAAPVIPRATRRAGRGVQA